MSEFLAEAQVLIRPNTAGFRAELQAELLAATRGLSVPIPVTATLPIGQFGTLATQAQRTAGALDEVAAAQAAGITASRQASIAAAAHSRQLGQLEKGALAASLSFTGLRGAVLAASAPFLAATVAVTAFGRGIAEAANFERQLNVLRATAGATAEEMERIRAQSIALGRDVSLPAVSASDAAEAMSSLAKAGLDVEESLAGARGVLQLATAAQISNAEATELSANALNAFNLAGAETTHVADVLANASNEAQGSILDMGIALRQASAVARQVGLSLDETVTLLTILARAGLAGSDAGTSLRVALTRLIAPTEDAQKVLNDLNISLRDAEGNLRPDVFAQIGAAMENLGKQEQARRLFEIFGQDAQRVAAILAREGAPALQETALAIQEQGTAAELAAAQTQGFTGQLDALGSEMATVGTNLQFLLTPLGGVVQLFTTLASGVNSAFEAFQDLGDAIDDANRPVVDFLGRIKDASNATDSFVGGLISRIPGVERAADAIGRVGEGAPQRVQQVAELSRAFEDQGSILAEDIKFLDQIIERLGRLPTESEIVKITVDPTQARTALNEVVEEARSKGTLSASALSEAFRRESQAQAGTLTEPMRRGLSDFQAEARAQGEAAGEAFVSGFNAAQVRGQLQAQKTAVAQAQAFGETGLEQLIAERERIDRILQSERAPIGPALESLLRERESVIREIESIQQQAADEKEAAAKRIQDRQREADDAFARGIRSAETGLQNRLLRAQTTEQLKDDLAAHTALRDFYRQKIGEVRKTVRDAELAAQLISSLTADLIRANAAIAEDERRIREERQKERQERIQRRQESLALDLEIAQTTGNVGAQRRALEAEIRFYQERIRATRRGSIQRKRWILELRRAQAELRDLKEETKSTANAFAELSFEFLQAQQGFAANLLGNLIPAGATGGLVGNVSQPSPATTLSRPTQATAALAQSKGGPSSGQAETQIDLMKQMVGLLRDLVAGRAHPEADYQRRTSGGSMEML